MKVFAIAVTLICMALMFLVRRDYKIAILFMSMILLSLVILPFKGITATMAISLAFIISELPHFKMHWKRIRMSIMLPYLLLVIVSFAVAVITSHHLHNLNDAGYFVLSELIVKQFVLVYAFLCLRRKNSIQPLLFVSFVSLVLMTIVGYINQVSGYSFMVDSFFEDTFKEYDFTTSYRFRVQATFVNPFDYGYMCVLLALLYLYGYQQKMVTLPITITAELCCFYGVVACNCRTIMFCYAFCALVYFLAIQKEKKTKIGILLGVLAVGLLLFTMVPSMRRVMLNVASIFDPTSVTKGSSLAMRIIQLTSVIFYIQGHVLFGRGVHFFTRELGWENGSELAADSDLYGLEGIYLNLLLERGVVGLVLFLAMMVLLIVFICHYRKLGRRMYALGLSVLMLYILFSFMTGELLSAAPSFCVLGYVIANQHVRKRYLEWKKKCRV